MGRPQRENPQPEYDPTQPQERSPEAYEANPHEANQPQSPYPPENDPTTQQQFQFQTPPPPQPAQYAPQEPQYQPTQYPPPNQQTNPVYPPPQPAPYPPQNSTYPSKPAPYPPQNPTYPPQPARYPPPVNPQQFPPQPVQFPPPALQTYPQQPQSPLKPQPNAAAGIPVQYPAVGTEPWSTGLFDCMEDPTNAVTTAFFPCLTFGQVAEIVDNGYTNCGTSGLLYGAIALLIWIPCIYSCTYRTKLRNKFGLMEAPAPDWVTHFLCEWCALCQEYRELQHRGFDPSIGWLGNVARQQQQQAQVAMVPPTTQTMMG
ncbi:PREDICTED: protein PLANT CADMIUM RESISTANCE 4-like [Nelumbo nucifera]|uniref:Protein PLANT CADMIUM RESISTANCE 4-like n=1 Tax=Nelumbo nucifera TaxID=4432 RepID=A0A1U8AE18_NELNU|nr:PREDICTED: protein PLANT CADMIUM RESISTANCE 4-like [Nelumbo nucifera]